MQIFIPDLGFLSDIFFALMGWLAMRALFNPLHITNSALQIRKAVTAYLKSKQLCLLDLHGILLQMLIIIVAKILISNALVSQNNISSKSHNFDRLSHFPFNVFFLQNNFAPRGINAAGGGGGWKGQFLCLAK